MSQPKGPEGIIKKQICDYLYARGIFFWVQSAGRIPGRKSSSRYSINGISDILGIYSGKSLAIEVKAPGGKVSQEQEEFLYYINRYGGIGFIARSVEDVAKILK